MINLGRFLTGRQHDRIKSTAIKNKGFKQKSAAVKTLDVFPSTAAQDLWCDFIDSRPYADSSVQVTKHLKNVSFRLNELITIMIYPDIIIASSTQISVI
jgi:hypothetical protein